MSCLGEDSLSDEFVLWNFKYAKLYLAISRIQPAGLTGNNLVSTSWSIRD